MEGLENLSNIHISARWDTDRYVPDKFEWVGDSNEVAITYELWNDLNPEFIQVKTINAIDRGYVFYFGPFHLRVTSIDAMRELIFCEWIDD